MSTTPNSNVGLRLYHQLQALDPHDANKEDYFDEETQSWDIDAIQADLDIAQNRMNTTGTTKLKPIVDINGNAQNSEINNDHDHDQDTNLNSNTNDKNSDEQLSNDNNHQDNAGQPIDGALTQNQSAEKEDNGNIKESVHNESEERFIRHNENSNDIHLLETPITVNPNANDTEPISSTTSSVPTTTTTVSVSRSQMQMPSPNASPSIDYENNGDDTSDYHPNPAEEEEQRNEDVIHNNSINVQQQQQNLSVIKETHNIIQPNPVSIGMMPAPATITRSKSKSKSKSRSPKIRKKSKSKSKSKSPSVKKTKKRKYDELNGHGHPSPAAKKMRYNEYNGVNEWNGQVLKKLVSLKRQIKHSSWFWEPVDEARHQAPNYYIICPMASDYGSICNKLEQYEYSSLDDLLRDCELVFINARIYNVANHAVHQVSLKLETKFKELLDSFVTNNAYKYGSEQTIIYWNKGFDKKINKTNHSQRVPNHTPFAVPIDSE